MIGSNPRHEATMLNARIRKTFVKKRIPIFSIGDPGELTYDYTVIGNTTDDLKKILNNEHEFSKKLSSSNKPIIIIERLLSVSFLMPILMTAMVAVKLRSKKLN